MFSLDNLFWLSLAAMLTLYWWQSGLFKGRARDLAIAHCQQLGIQLLDQSMVIVGFWPVRSRSGSLMFRRSYQFEFSSTGDRRYQGKLVLEGMLLKSIELEAYRLHDSD
ncbi:MAG: DUF3301 domain-containing protein [Gammaproteobacteria bacterium]|nr:DUF3301 domain-containing protein [Gammaproteobacteria bacterium]